MEQASQPLLHESEPTDDRLLNQLDDVDQEAISELQPAPSPRPWTKVWQRTKGFLIFLLPIYMHPGRPSFRANLHATAWLDALRGYAALFVFMYHIFGLPPVALFHLPFIRVFWDGGPGMVALFFVISGYVLSVRILKSIHNKDSAKVVDGIASSIFRRWFRLFPSCGFAIFATGIAIQLKLWYPPNSPIKPTLLSQMLDCAWDLTWMANPFADVHSWSGLGSIKSRYVGQLWTIPLEYRGSIAVFLFLAASAKMSVRGRMIFLWVLLLASYYWIAVYVGEFLFGMFLAELSLLRHPERLGRLPQQEEEMSEKPTPRRRWLLFGSKVAYCLCLVAGFFLMGQPLDGNYITKGPFPWDYLRLLVPSYYGIAQYTLWLGVGSSLIVFALESYRPLQIPFEWSFSQYLGKLSFGIYAMHRLVAGCLYYPIIVPWSRTHFGKSYWALIPGQLFTAFVVLWIADYFTRLDNQVVRFARWLERKTFTKWSV